MKTLRSLFVLLTVIFLLPYWLRRHIMARVLKLPPVHHRAHVEENLRVPMADGISLAADHYFPSVYGNFPTVLIRSPYGRNSKAGAFGLLMSFSAQRFAERGYHVLIQDTRGRFESEGVFDPYINERGDGLATLDWLKTQPWFNGAVGLWGGSYLGIVQWVISDAEPVKAMMPAITGSQLQQIVYPDGALDLNLAIRWMAIFQALDSGRSLIQGMRQMAKLEQKIAPAFTTLPVIEADKAVVGQPQEFYRKWLEHTDPEDALWQDVHHTMRPQQVAAPVHFIGGWYDFFLRAMLADYNVVKAAGRKPYLTIGPWHHFSEIISLKELREGIAWFDAHLKGDVRGLREKPVQIYVMGADEWRDMDEWPPPSQPTHFYLHAHQGLNQEAPEAGEGADHYRYDPADPTPALGGAQFSPLAGPYDNRPLEARPDVLTFTTLPLSQPLEIIGPVRLQLHVKSSLDSTDFFGRLCDVHPNGRSVNICDGLYRIQSGKTEPQPDGSSCIEIDMWATAYHFKPGHRIRLQVSSGAHPRWSRNLGTGDSITGSEMKVAHQTVCHDTAHASALVLPVV